MTGSPVSAMSAMAVEGRAGAPPSSEDAVLFGQLHPRTVDQPDQRNVQTGGASSVTRSWFSDCPGSQAPERTLLSKPATTHHFPEIRARPSTMPVVPSVFSAGLSSVCRGESSRVDQPPDSFPDGEKSLFVHDFRRRSRLPYSPRRFLDPVFFGLQLRPVPWVGADRGCGEERHFFKVTVHDVSPFPALSYVVVVRAFPDKENFLLSIE